MDQSGGLLQRPLARAAGSLPRKCPVHVTCFTSKPSRYSQYLPKIKGEAMRRPLISMLILFLASGCAEFDSIYRETKVPSNEKIHGKLVAVDAKQRFLLTSRHKVFPRRSQPVEVKIQPSKAQPSVKNDHSAGKTSENNRTNENDRTTRGVPNTGEHRDFTQRLAGGSHTHQAVIVQPSGINGDPAYDTPYMQAVYCAEPSPDAFSVFSAAIEASGSGKAEAIKAALKTAFGETGATIGLRTQAIQLLRDAMYRACEGYLGGGLTSEQYFELSKKYQKSMVSLLAIQELTGAATPSQIVLRAGSSIEVDSTINEVKAQKDAAEKQLNAANDAVRENEDKIVEAEKTLGADKNKKCSEIKKEEEKKVAACKVRDEAKGARDELADKQKKAKKNFDEWQTVFDKVENAKSLTATGDQTVIAPGGTQLDAASVKALADKVWKMVRDVFADDIIQGCLQQVEVLTQEITTQDITLASAQLSSSSSKTFDAVSLKSSKQKNEDLRRELIKTCTEIMKLYVDGSK